MTLLFAVTSIAYGRAIARALSGPLLLLAADIDKSREIDCSQPMPLDSCEHPTTLRGDR